MSARPAQAATPEPTGFEQAVDDVAGVVVNGLNTVLFYPLFVSAAETQSSVAEPDVEEVAAMLERIRADGFEPGEASLVLTVPRSVGPQAAAALQRELTQRFVPSDPKGTRRLTVTRSRRATTARLKARTGGLPIIVLWLLFGAAFFTFRMGFVNIRAFRHAFDVVRGRFDNPDDPGEVSHFQALASALSATVGLGNIAGVAVAIATGGPGAVVWIVVAGFFGMSSKFVECTLGQKYREIAPSGQVMGGPMFYLRKGLAETGRPRLGKGLAVVFAILCVGGSIGGGNTFQVNQSLGIIQEQVPLFAEYRWLYGLLMAIAVGVVILGGIRRIAATAEKVVPLMCGVYVLACLYVLFANADAIPSAFATIVRSAWTPEAGYGGFVGVLVTGIRRAVFSNEAGVGSAAIAHSAARTDHPVREGIVALLEPFVDTIVVCTMTGLVIVITGAYAAPENFDVIAAAQGAALTSRAMATEISWFPVVLAVAVLMFAYSTLISWSYYGDRAWCFLFGPRSAIVYKLLFLSFVFLGSIVTGNNVLNFGDLMILSMAFPNILGILFLSSGVRRDLDDYLRSLAAGKFKIYK
ncbi:MAG: alanine:cation symporter family protein [Myxococcales bacterium FL481]|nr:MAG: alanine:cation symporter family protein [Myxococcales bacterium FL481]